MDPLDDKVKAALQAFEAVASPRGYFDELAHKIEARLEGEVMQQSSDGTPRTENTGLHDIQALAKSTRQRISRRQTSQHDIDESVLSSSSSGMHAIALPDPAKMIALPTPEEARALSASMQMAAATDAVAEPGAPAAAREPSFATPVAGYAAPPAKKGVPVWLWAGGGIAAAAAAVAAFVMIGGGGDDKDAAPSAAEERVAARDEAPPDLGAAAPNAEQEGVTVTGLVDATVGSGTAAGSAVITPLEPAGDTAKAAETDEAEEPTDKATSKPKDRKRDDGDKEASSGKSKTTPPPDDAKSGSGSGSGSASGTAKGTGTTTKKGGGESTGGGGAVLGEGDADELGIGDAIKGGGGDSGKPKKTELTSKELRAGLDAVKPKAEQCYDGAVGTVKVKLTVSPSGSVTKASASGDLAGTPAADCVVSAIKSASFPAWDGAPMSTTYAVLLSD